MSVESNNVGTVSARAERTTIAAILASRASGLSRAKHDAIPCGRGLDLVHAPRDTDPGEFRRKRINVSGTIARQVHDSGIPVQACEERETSAVVVMGIRPRDTTTGSREKLASVPLAYRATVAGQIARLVKPEHTISGKRGEIRAVSVKVRSPLTRFHFAPVEQQRTRARVTRAVGTTERAIIRAVRRSSHGDRTGFLVGRPGGDMVVVALHPFAALRSTEQNTTGDHSPRSRRFMMASKRVGA